MAPVPNFSANEHVSCQIFYLLLSLGWPINSAAGSCTSTFLMVCMSYGPLGDARRSRGRLPFPVCSQRCSGAYFWCVFLPICEAVEWWRAGFPVVFSLCSERTTDLVHVSEGGGPVVNCSSSWINAYSVCSLPEYLLVRNFAEFCEANQVRVLIAKSNFRATLFRIIFGYVKSMNDFRSSMNTNHINELYNIKTLCKCIPFAFGCFWSRV